MKQRLPVLSIATPRHRGVGERPGSSSHLGVQSFVVTLTPRAHPGRKHLPGNRPRIDCNFCATAGIDSIISFDRHCTGQTLESWSESPIGSNFCKRRTRRSTCSKWMTDSHVLGSRFAELKIATRCNSDVPCDV